MQSRPSTAGRYQGTFAHRRTDNATTLRRRHCPTTRICLQRIIATQLTRGVSRAQSGEIAYITTGAPLPPGADAVVMVENTRKADGGGAPGDLLRVAIGAQAEPGLDVRPRGADVRQVP